MSPARFATILILPFLLAAHLVYAYLDPGSGSIILQAVLAGAAGLVVLVRLFWKRLTGLFKPRDDKARR